MDKDLSKHLFVRSDVRTADWLMATRDSADERAGAGRRFREESIAKLGLPVVVKPSTQGSAFGLKRVDAFDDLVPAVVGAFSYGTNIVVERWIEGRELAVTILGPAEEPQPLPIIEIHSRSGYYSYEAHYEMGEAEFLVPAPLEPEEAAHVRDTAVAAYQLAGCRDFARVDLILDASGVAQVLEINTIPGLTETGLTPIAADEAAIGFDELVMRVAQRSIAESAAPAARR
jgi:D-alanine-D-alanine ligase